MELLKSICRQVREYWENYEMDDEERARIYYEFEKRMNENLNDGLNSFLREIQLQSSRPY